MIGTRVTAIGFSVEVPSGWEAEIDTGAGEAGDVVAAPKMNKMPRLHMANFALPEMRGDFGSGAVENMRRGDVFLCVLEEDPAMATTRLYADNAVPAFDSGHYQPHQMQRPIAGQSGAQAFFHVGPRAFVVYVVVGEHLGRSAVVDEVNQILSSLRFD